MKLLGMRISRPRPGQWVAGLGLVAALLGRDATFLAFRDLDYGGNAAPSASPFLGIDWAARWYPYAIIAIIFLSLVAAMLGATLLSLAGSLLSLGGIFVLPFTAMDLLSSVFGLQLLQLGPGFFIMVAGCLLAAISSAIDVRERLTAAKA